MHRLRGDVELVGRGHRDRQRDQRRRHVADQLPEHEGQEHQSEQERVRPRVSAREHRGRARASRRRGSHAGNASGSRNCEGDIRRRAAVTAQERGHRPVDADQRRQHRDGEHQQREACPGLAGACDQQLSRTGRRARRVERLADDEERRDEDHGRVAEATERLIDRQQLPLPRATKPRRMRRRRWATGPRRRGDRDREDEKGDRESLLYVGRLVSDLKTDTTVEPTPEVSD